MTTSASCLSATARATVAPTLPAPPTTVTFLFIAAFPVASFLFPAFSSQLSAFSSRFLVPAWSDLAPSSQLHVLNDRIAELRGLQLGRPFHLPGEIVGDLLLLNRLLEAGFDQLGGFRPAEIPEHHHAREDHRAR